jgi:Tfp pilus assembly protein PilF
MNSSKRFQWRVLLALGVSLIVMVTVGGCASSSKNDLSKADRARMLVDLANGAILEGDSTGALQALLQAEELSPDLPELHHSKALAYYAKKDLLTALVEARKAVELMPNYSDANNTLGKLLVDAGKYREAEKPLLKAANDPVFRDAFKAHTNLGILYYRQGDYDLALKHLDKAVEMTSAQACVANYYRGHVYLRSGKFNDAITSYDLATQRFCAGFADAHLALGIAYERSKQYDRARKKFLDIKQTFPNSKIAEQAMDRLRYLP